MLTSSSNALNDHKDITVDNSYIDDYTVTISGPISSVSGTFISKMESFGVAIDLSGLAETTSEEVPDDLPDDPASGVDDSAAGLDDAVDDITGTQPSFTSMSMVMVRSPHSATVSW